MNESQSTKSQPYSRHRRILPLLGVLTIMALLCWWILDRADLALRNELQQQAQLAAEALNQEDIQALTGTEADLNTPVYLQLKEQLGRITEARDDCRFIYLLGRLPNDGQVFFFVDNEPVGSADESPAGQIYEEISPEYLRAFETRSALVGGPVTDRWGTWITALVPIVDPRTDELLAILGMDIAANNWHMAVMTRSVLPMSLLLIMVILVGAGMRLNSLRAKASTKSVQNRLLIPLAGTLSLLVICFSLLLYRSQQDHMNDFASYLLQDIDKEFTQALKEQTQALAGIEDVLLADPELRTLLQQRDQHGLLNKYGPLYTQLKTNYGITHFYFSGPDRVNLLRVHKPQKNGDLINRFTTLEAERTGTTAAGIELGPLCTFTLRVVQPVYVDDTLIGYLELGKEIEDILQRIHLNSQIELTVAINKKLLDRQKWEKSMADFGRNSDWDQDTEKVLIYSSMAQFPEQWEVFMAEEGHEHHATDCETKTDGKTWRVLVSPLIDASGTEVGDLVVYTDISKAKAKFLSQTRITAAMVMVLLVALFGFLFLMLRQVDLSIARREQELARSEQFQRKLYETSPDFILILDSSGVIQKMNRLQPGQQESDVVGRNAAEFVTPAEKEIFNQAFQRALDSGQLQSIELQVNLPDGRHHFLNRLNPAPFANDENAIVIVAADITDSKTSEQQLADALQESERMNRLMMGRELRVIEIKAEVNALLKELNRNSKYESVE